MDFKDLFTYLSTMFTKLTWWQGLIWVSLLLIIKLTFAKIKDIKIEPAPKITVPLLRTLLDKQISHDNEVSDLSDIYMAQIKYVVKSHITVVSDLLFTWFNDNVTTDKSCEECKGRSISSTLRNVDSKITESTMDFIETYKTDEDLFTTDFLNVLGRTVRATIRDNYIHHLPVELDMFLMSTVQQYLVRMMDEVITVKKKFVAKADELKETHTTEKETIISGL